MTGKYYLNAKGGWGMDNRIFAERLKESREAKNITAAELAEEVGINKATIYRYEAAEISKIKLHAIKAMAECLNVNPDYLMGVTDDKHTIKEVEADITDDEKMLLELFRRVPEENQQMVLDMIRVALKNGQ